MGTPAAWLHSENGLLFEVCLIEGTMEACVPGYFKAASHLASFSLIPLNVAAWTACSPFS
jgi:hypothetical protein